MAKCGGGSVLTVLLQCFSLTVVVAMATTMAPIPAPAYTKTGCSNSCGNVSIPFPFGVEEGCYLDDTFRISCGSPGRPFLANSLVLPNKDKKIEVLGIFLDGRLRASAPVAQDCYNNSGTETRSNAEYVQSNFPISYAWNKFVSVGCNGNAALGTFSTTLEVDGYVSACASACNSMLDVVNGSCSRIGCCQTDIPKNMTEFVILASNSADHQNVSRFSPCNYAFVVERGVYNFSSADIVDLQNVDDFPVIFDWAIGNTGCQEAKKIPETFACRDNNSFCYDFDNRFGYRCNCTEGYRGNPYLPQGCQDINECEENSHDCPDAKFCHNTVGSYTCSCPKGHHGDGRMSGGGGCIADRPQNNKIIIGTSVGVFAVLVAVSFAHFAIKRRNAKRNRERCFKENGGLLLQRLLSKTDPSEKRGTIFSESELKKATKDFSQSEVIGEGGFGMVYKGTLEDGRAVAIKKSRKVDRREVQQFINEVNILSQINHPNVVKLIGCCLDSQIPMLVSEFITNNTLFHHLHEEGKKSSLSWEVRLRIALETAKALVCMHSIMPMQIIHRDIKSANILLDDNFTAKVSDFGISRLVPLDQYELPTDVQGTLGYIDPEYFDTGLLNEKSDVYSFGIILAELLTGKRVIYPKKPEQNLATVFVSAVEKGELFQILEDRVRKEGRPDQLLRIAKLTRRCLRRRKDERPTMKAVEKELEETTLEIVEHQ